MKYLSLGSAAFHLSYVTHVTAKSFIARWKPMPVQRPRTRWEDYFEDLGWIRLGLQPSEMLGEGGGP